MKFLLQAFGVVFLCVFLMSMAIVLFTVPSEVRLSSYFKNSGEDVSYGVVKNGVVLGKHNSDDIIPIASVSKVIVAIEFAHQVAYGLINSNARVSVDHLNSLLIRGTDGGAHTSWLNNEVFDKDSISLMTVVQGMIKYSSNANTEYVMDVLTLSSINKRLDSLGISNEHTKLFFFPSGVLIPSVFYKNFTASERIRRLSELDANSYQEKCEKIYQMRKKGELRWELSFDESMQRIWKDRLPMSSVNAYLKVAGFCNSRSFFSERIYRVLDEVMNIKKANVLSSLKLSSMSLKGGSAIGIRTKIIYFTDDLGDKYEIAYFINDLSLIDQVKISSSVRAFDYSLILNKGKQLVGGNGL